MIRMPVLMGLALGSAIAIWDVASIAYPGGSGIRIAGTPAPHQVVEPMRPIDGDAEQVIGATTETVTVAAERAPARPRLRAAHIDVRDPWSADRRVVAVPAEDESSMDLFLIKQAMRDGDTQTAAKLYDELEHRLAASGAKETMGAIRAKLLRPIDASALWPSERSVPAVRRSEPSNPFHGRRRFAIDTGDPFAN